ncbi:MAG: NADH-quinone oxidoreductase subunit J [Phototrophicaceae bacterium]
MELALFFLLALTAIVSAAGMIYQKNAVHSALFLILNFGCVALLFLMLDAPFISMVQIAVYAGAIMVLFLFVIMLLGAEQTTDTDARQFGWLTQAATVLGAAFLFAMAIPLVLSGGLDLPEAPGDAPRLRLIHAANVDTPVNISIGETTFEDVVINDITPFTEFEAGEYDVVVSDAAGATLFETSLALEPDQLLTIVAYGADGLESVAAIANDLSATEDDQARINITNLVTDNPLYLVNIGRDRQLQVSADGVIEDTVLTDAIPFGETVTVTLTDGRFNLRLAHEVEAGEYELTLVGDIDGWMIEEATEQTLIFTPDYESVNDAQFGFRSTVVTSILDVSEPFGSPGDIGGLLFIDYLLPVNLVGFLLLVALIGVIVLTRPEGSTQSRRSTLNRRRKVSRPLISVITDQTGRNVVVDTPILDEPSSSD